MSNSVRIDLFGYQCSFNVEKIAYLRRCEEHAQWAVGTLSRVAAELIRLGTDNDDVDHKEYLGWVRDLQELRDDYESLRDLDISLDGEIPNKE